MTAMMARLAAAFVCVAALAGCVAEETWAPEAQVQAAAFRPGGTPTVTLFTMINNRSGGGGHSALLIDGEERVLFDPAGSWHHPNIPERNDVLYGMSPQFMDFYLDFHARETFHVVTQEIDVTPAQAAALIAAVEQYGAVPPARCSYSISSVLSQMPGFDTVSRSFFPKRTMAGFAELPGVRSAQIFDDDEDDNLEVLQAQARAEQSQAAVRALQRDE